jgi:hypothetical protein
MENKTNFVSKIPQKINFETNTIKNNQNNSRSSLDKYSTQKHNNPLLKAINSVEESDKHLTYNEHLQRKE